METDSTLAIPTKSAGDTTLAVWTSTQDACGSKRALGAAVKNLQATSLSMDLVQRPRADGGAPGALGVPRDGLSLGP